MTGEISERVRELIRQICKKNEVEILKGHISKDHIHLFVSVPPQLAISKLVQLLKGTTSYKLLRENKFIQKNFWGKHLWGRGFFVVTSGNITDEVIMKYISDQDIQEQNEDFKIIQ